jgi:hypothetical protein
LYAWKRNGRSASVKRPSSQAAKQPSSQAAKRQDVCRSVVLSELCSPLSKLGPFHQLVLIPSVVVVVSSHSLQPPLQLQLQLQLPPPVISPHHHAPHHFHCRRRCSCRSRPRRIGCTHIHSLLATHSRSPMYSPFQITLPTASTTCTAGQSCSVTWQVRLDTLCLSSAHVYIHCRTTTNVQPSLNKATALSPFTLAA